MRIGIISDTHDQLERTQRAVDQLIAEKAERLFHCGDLIEPSMVDVCAVVPSYFVFGNNDVDRVPGIRNAIAKIDNAECLDWGGEVQLSGKRIAMAHGHHSSQIRRLLANAPDYLFSGHSHVKADRREGTTRRINPGALHRAREFTVAVLDLATDELRFLAVPKSVPMSAPKRTGIAVVEHAQRYLAGIRPDDVPLAGFAEFPGGKCHPDESATDCAVRECIEESGLSVVADRMLQHVDFEYPHGRVDLYFILCHPTDAADVCERHGHFRWVSAEELLRLKFPEANASVIRLLTQNIGT